MGGINMALTIRDCLKLGNLTYATLVAGEKGLGRIVENVTVTEIPDAPASQLYGNELMLSALYQIREDEARQCEFIEKINDAGVSGLVIFYLGVIVKKLGKRVIDTADRLGFPLIVMPENSNDYSYVDAIQPITEAILETKKEGISMFCNLFENLYNTPISNRNLKFIVKKASEILNCTLILVDSLFKPFEYYIDNRIADIDIADICYQCQRASIDTLEKNLSIFVELGNNGLKREAHAVPLDRNSYKYGFILAINNGNKAVSVFELQQISEVVMVFMQIWGFSPRIKSEYEYVDLILSGRILDGSISTKHSKILTFYENIYAMIVINKTTDSQEMNNNFHDSKILNSMNIIIRKYFFEGFVSFYGNSLVILISRIKKSKRNDKKLYDLGDELVQELYNRFQILTVAGLCIDFNSLNDISIEYQKLNNILYVANYIYPNKKIFYNNDLFLPRICSNLIKSPEHKYTDELIKLLDPLKKFDKRYKTDYLYTLMVYLLDCNCSIRDSCDKLHIHPNTLKYRLKKTESIIGLDPRKWPENMEIALAIALCRMMNLSN